MAGDFTGIAANDDGVHCYCNSFNTDAQAGYGIRDL